MSNRTQGRQAAHAPCGAVRHWIWSSGTREEPRRDPVDTRQGGGAGGATDPREGPPCGLAGPEASRASAASAACHATSYSEKGRKRLMPDALPAPLFLPLTLSAPRRLPAGRRRGAPVRRPVVWASGASGASGGEAGRGPVPAPAPRLWPAVISPQAGRIAGRPGGARAGRDEDWSGGRGFQSHSNQFLSPASDRLDGN